MESVHLEAYQRPLCGPDDPPLPFALNTIVTNPISSETYRLVHPLGNGSYAIVYLVEESPSGYRYAIKCLSKQNLTPDQLSIQTNEINLHARLPNHKNLVKLHTAFEDKEWWFLVLEYVPGSDLYWWITQKRDLYFSATDKQLDERERLVLISAVFSQCLEAVRMVHSMGMSHRDLKPENFLIHPSDNDEGGVLVKLTDFGLATTDKYSTDFDCGSKPYMSYECRNPLMPSYEPREADIWSLGIILLNLIWHRSPWSDPCLEECESFNAFMKDKIGFLMRRFEGMPKSIATFLATRVFGKVEERIQIQDWQIWCKQLVEMMLDGVEIPPPMAIKKTFGFNPLSLNISMTSLRGASKSKDSTPNSKTNSKKISNLFPLLSTSNSAKGSFDFTDDEEEVDFTQPIVFGDGVSVRVKSSANTFATSDVRNNSNERLGAQESVAILLDTEAMADKNVGEIASEQENEEKEGRKSDNDSGFGTDEFGSSFNTTDAISSNEKPVTGIAKYIPPKFRFTLANNSSNSDKTGDVSAVSPIPIPFNHQSRRYKSPRRTKNSFDDSVGSMPSSFGGHGINVGGFAYQQRPFAPTPAVWRKHTNLTSSNLRKKNSKDFFADRERDIEDWRQQSPQKRSVPSIPVSTPVTSTAGSTANYSSSPTAQSQITKAGRRKRSSTVSAADPVKLFNGPMPGMTILQQANRSMVSLSATTASTSPPLPHSSEKLKPFMHSLIPPTPMSTDDVNKELALAETGLQAEVLISPVSSDADQDELMFKPDDDLLQDTEKLNIVPKNTMTELGRLLRSIVGYNRSVKVGGEGKG